MIYISSISYVAECYLLTTFDLNFFEFVMGPIYFYCFLIFLARADVPKTVTTIILFFFLNVYIDYGNEEQQTVTKLS
jgi:hypothetical protein